LGIGLRLSDVDTFAPELHNPEITEPTGSGNVPQTNYRLLAAMAVHRGEISREGFNQFIEQHGMPGYSPTQGHIASAVPFLGHARQLWQQGKLERAMFVAKGSLFLGRMTTLSDGMSFLLLTSAKVAKRDKLGHEAA
jgi:betaine reductase